MSTCSVLYENLSEWYYLVQRHPLSPNQVINSTIVNTNLMSVPKKVISVTTKAILTTKEAITATLKVTPPPEKRSWSQLN